MRGWLKRPSLRREEEIFPLTFKAVCARLGIPVPYCLRPENINKPVSAVLKPIEKGKSMIEMARSDDSELCHEMLATYGFTEEQMHRTAERFHLGRSKSGKTIYWMIDDLGRCLDGHIGSASHDADTWVSTLLKRRYPEAAPYLNTRHCLFGLHQLSECESIKESQAGPLMSIGIVESERSAVLLSELCPDLLWLAYSYYSNLTTDKFEPLQGRKVTLYPRLDPYREYYWSALELADRVRRVYHDIEVDVSSFLNDHATDDQKARNIDILVTMFAVGNANEPIGNGP